MNFIACLPFERASSSVVLTGTASTPATYMAAQDLTTFALFAMIIQLRQGGWSMVLFFWFICQILQYNHRQHNTFLFHNAISSFAKYLHTYINGMASCSNNHNWPSVLYITFLFPSKSSYILKRPQNIWTLNFLAGANDIIRSNSMHY